MKKIIIYILSILILLFMYSYLTGKLDPKLFSINNLTIKVPKDTYIKLVSIGKKKYNLFFIPFIKIKNYTLKKDEEIHMVFMGNMNNTILSFNASFHTREYIEKYILELGKLSTLKSKKYKTCLIYSTKDDKYYNSIVYNTNIHLFVSIYSNNIIENNKIVDSLCEDVILYENN